MSKSVSIGLADYSRRVQSINAYLQAQGKETLYYSGKLLGSKEFGDEVSKTLEQALTKIGDAYLRFSESMLKIGRIGSDFLSVELHSCPTCLEADNDGLMHCWMDAGYIAGALETMLGKRFTVIETKCSGIGSDHCEFIVTEDQHTKTMRPQYTAFKRFETSPM